MTKRTRLVHFIGIGGIGMSGIAEVLLNLGFKVRGSDLKASDVTRRLQSLGGDIRINHDAINAEGVDVVVISSAVRADNAEIEHARAHKIPVIRRAEMLGELMRLKFGIAIGGTHGKTTTTSLVATILTNAALDPTVVVGGKLNKLGTNAKLGAGPYLVAEADESDGSFLHLSPTIAVVTNIDAEHLDHYTNGIEEIRDTFVSFVNRIPFYGLAVLCMDHPGVQAIIPRVERRFTTYGMNPQADYQARAIEFDGPLTSFELVKRGQSAGRFTLRMLGLHNVQNALAALAVADELGISDADARGGFDEFDGVDRRFSIRGVENDIMVVDDYGHHPEEIRATLKGARQAYPDRKIIVVFQPHRYTRTRDLAEDFATAFNEADQLFLLPIYAAGEPAIEGVSSAHLIERVRQHGHRSVSAIESVDQVAQTIGEHAKPHDLVITLGAGDITKTGEPILKVLAHAPKTEAKSGG
jgi:UDP-N-acetylmuramate--alanine ligase